MAEVRPFCAVRPAGELAAQVAALPYDVYNRKEASLAVRENPLSFLNIDRAETQFPDEVDAYEECVYEKARELFEARMADGTFLQDDVLLHLPADHGREEPDRHCGFKQRGRLSESGGKKA